mgnify:CR=1 FL=1
MKTLTIISHTEHYKTADGSIVGLGSTVTEINHLLDVFDAVIHVAMLHDGPAPASALPYTSNRIHFMPLPAVGGPRVLDKLAILWRAPLILRVIHKAINQTDYFQFRAPTGIGVFVIPYLIVWRSKKGWFKYAGNWKQKNAPVAYSFQRWLLTKQKRYVTINGKWKNQAKSCLTFENPCLTDKDLLLGNDISENKNFKNQSISFCFVGRLEKEKGLDLLIEAFKKLPEDQKAQIKIVHIVGDGKAKENSEREAIDDNIKFKFHGFLSRNDVHEIYKASHAIVLPSASEGFPKVIAEAMNFGCLPIVSNVSSIGHYVKEGINGFLLDTISVDSLLIQLQKVLNLSGEDYNNMVSNEKGVERFTYSYYNNRVKNELL